MRERNTGALNRADGLPLVVVHGGAEALRYRNVLEALAAALATGADCFEFDVRRTADDVLVVHHDEDVGPQKLRDLRCSDAERAAAASGYQLPRLEAVLDRARGALRLDVEIKEAGYENIVLTALGAAGFGHEEFVVTSFEQPALDAIHSADKDVVTGLLVYDMTGARALELFKRSSASFLGPDHAMLDDETLRDAAASNVSLIPWTVNDQAQMARLMRAEAVKGLITDRPAEAVDIRHRLA